ncbi:MAG: hypothetical protein IJP35_08325 [Clostridia bacterium]|nr:hypothetical protein [Clostridia bacterium]
MFTPDYRNLQKAAQNIEVQRFPLYEHIICPEIAEAVLGKSFSQLIHGDYADKKEYFRNYCEFFRQMGYDTISGNHKKGVIQYRAILNGIPLRNSFVSAGVL